MTGYWPKRSGKSRRRQQPTAVEQATRLARAALLEAAEYGREPLDIPAMIERQRAYEAVPGSIDVDRELLDVVDREHVWQEVAPVDGEERQWTCVRCGLTEGITGVESECPGTGGILGAAIRDQQHRRARAWWAEHGHGFAEGA